MEAVAKWDFVPTGTELLSFKKGDILKLLYKEVNETNWYHAELDGKEGLVSTNMIEIAANSWKWVHFIGPFQRPQNTYYGYISRTLAKDILLQNNGKKFLIRESATTGFWFLSYKPSIEKIWHFKICRHKNCKFTFFTDYNGRRRQFNSLNELCDYVRKHAWYSAPWWNPSLFEDSGQQSSLKHSHEWSQND